MALACLVYLGVIIGVAIIAPILLPNVGGQSAGNLLSTLQRPSAHHLLGTDSLGRDVLERLLVGTRVTILGVGEAVLVALVVGVPFGLIAGFFGGAIDRSIGWLADLTFSMPAIVVVLVVLAVFPQSLAAAMVAFGLIASPGLMRVVRSAVYPVARELYIDAARVSGLSRVYIMSRHVLPRISGVVIVQTSLLAAWALLTQTGLAFLDLVVKAPAPSWGGMVANGVNEILLDPWLIWPAGIAIALTILALGLLADAARDSSSEKWSRGNPRSQRRRAAPANTITWRERQPAENLADNPLLTIAGLTVAIRAGGPNEVTLIDDVSLAVKAGESVAVVGESGCGKTITAMAILGLLPPSASITRGRIMFGGTDLAQCRESDLRKIRGKEVALVSQEPMVSLDPAYRVGSQIAEVARRHERCSRRVAQRRALDLLELVHLPDPSMAAALYPHELSGGMTQRVAIARALAGTPRLLIADEPTTALDVTVQAEILDLLREIQTSRGMSILLVTHDWGVVADLCRRAVVMYAGQVVERSDVRGVFRRPLHPYTAALLAADPHNTTEVDLLPTIPGNVPAPGSWPVGCHFHPRCTYATGECVAAPVEIQPAAGDRETRCIHHNDLLARR